MKRADVQYWDSCIFMAYLSGTDEAAVEVIDELVTLQERGSITVVISTFVIAEVRKIAMSGAHGPELGKEEQIESYPIDGQKLDRIKRLFDSDILDYRVVTPRVAQIAADIGNQFAGLLPPDCVHIATAIDSRVDVLFTLDGVMKRQRRRPRHMLRYDQRIGTPPLRILEPYVPMGDLFDAVRLNQS